MDEINAIIHASYFVDQLAEALFETNAASF
jgi:hypothetical protein